MMKGVPKLGPIPLERLSKSVLFLRFKKPLVFSS